MGVWASKATRQSRPLPQCALKPQHRELWGVGGHETVLPAPDLAPLTSPDSQQVTGTPAPCPRPPDGTPRPRSSSRTPGGQMLLGTGSPGPEPACGKQCPGRLPLGALSGPPPAAKGSHHPTPGSISLCPADAILVCGIPPTPCFPLSSLLYPHRKALLSLVRKAATQRG